MIRSRSRFAELEHQLHFFVARAARQSLEQRADSVGDVGPATRSIRSIDSGARNQRASICQPAVGRPQGMIEHHFGRQRANRGALVGRETGRKQSPGPVVARLRRRSGARGVDHRSALATVRALPARGSSPSAAASRRLGAFAARAARVRSSRLRPTIASILAVLPHFGGSHAFDGQQPCARLRPRARQLVDQRIGEHDVGRHVLAPARLVAPVLQPSHQSARRRRTCPPHRTASARLRLPAHSPVKLPPQLVGQRQPHCRVVAAAHDLAAAGRVSCTIGRNGSISVCSSRPASSSASINCTTSVCFKCASRPNVLSLSSRLRVTLL